MKTTIFVLGTGKTTTLINIVKDRMSTGMAPDKIGFFSLVVLPTEARDRAWLDLQLDNKSLQYFRTLHSLAFQWLGLNTRDVFRGSDYNELGKCRYRF